MAPLPDYTSPSAVTLAGAPQSVQAPQVQAFRLAGAPTTVAEAAKPAQGLNETLVLSVGTNGSIQRISPMINGLTQSAVLDVQTDTLSTAAPTEKKSKHPFKNGVVLTLKIPAQATTVTVSAMWAEPKTGEMTSMKRSYAFDKEHALGPDRTAQIALIVGRLDGLTITATLVYA